MSDVTSLSPLVTRWPVHDAAEQEAVRAVLAGSAGGGSALTNYWTAGEQGHGRAFEAEWARLVVGLPHALTVSNGTTALECALRGVGCDGLEPGWEVIVPARTFVATASAVVHAGGRPVLADIDAGSLCVTAEMIEARLTPRTVGVIVVHYGGLPCPDMDAIVRLCMSRGLWIVEDCAHAHGAPVGRASHAACWSFCVGKIMSTGGEGGMVACLDDGVAARMAAYRDHGRYCMVGTPGQPLSEFTYTVDEFGSNCRMTEMQAALGRVQIGKLGGWVARRREVAAAYDEVLGLLALHTTEQRAVHARYLYQVVLGGAAERTRVMARLRAAGIPVGFGGCPSLAREPAFVKRGWCEPTPVADDVGERVLTLPVYPTMTDVEVGRVREALTAAIGGI